MIGLDGTRRKEFDQCVKNQEKVKGIFDKGARLRLFQKDNLVLMWDKRKEKPSKHGKFDSVWMGPYRIDDMAGPNS